jgi:4-carboxymuconolactone decarboxylase
MADTDHDKTEKDKDKKMDEEKQAYLAQMAKKRGYVLDFHKVLVAEDLPFMKALNGLLETAYMEPRTLDRKTKELAFIAALVGLGAAKQHIAIHMESAKRAGATKQEVLEMLEMLVTPCGVPKFMGGYEVWAEAFPVQRVELPGSGSGE